jgi:hypothetical protein
MSELSDILVIVFGLVALIVGPLVAAERDSE